MNILVLRGSLALEVGREHLGVGLAKTQRDKVIQVGGVKRSQDFLARSLILADAFRLLR